MPKISSVNGSAPTEAVLPYADWDTVRAYLDLEGTADDALGAELALRATAGIEVHCRRRFRGQDFVRALAAPAGETLFFDDDLLSINTLTLSDGRTLTESDLLLLPRNTWPKQMIRLRGGSWLAGDVLVDGRWGWSETPPPDVVQAAVRWTAWLYRQRDGAFGQTARPEIGVIEIPAALPVDIERMLRSYVRPRLGTV